MGTVHYTLAQEWWLQEGSVDVYDVKDNPIATIPIGFLRESGDANWRFIYEAIIDCIENSGWLRTCDGLAVSDDSPTIAGRYTFIRSGPISKRRGRAPGMGDDDDSTVSNSKRSSAGQNKFKTYLIARDQRCLLTDAEFQRCTPSHIVPFSRGELYPAILGRRVTSLIEPWMGLLLADDLHHAFDRYDWALYPREHEYVVHYFNHFGQDQKHLHGKIISFDRFKAYPNWKPDSKLLLWHHRQCVQMHFRGFTYGISAEDTRREMESFS